jgi:hypothetical protein
MRTLHWTAFAALTILSAAPAAAQVSARLNINVPAGRPGRVYAGNRGRLVVREYDANRFGPWENYYDQWTPQTVYVEDGSYYDYPVDAYATPVVVYGYRNEIFLPPRAPEFFAWRDRWHPEFYRQPYRGRPVVQNEFRGGYRSAPAYDRGVRDYRPAPRFEGREQGYRAAPRPEQGRPVTGYRGGDRGRPSPSGQGGGGRQGTHGGNSGGHGPRSGSGH